MLGHLGTICAKRPRWRLSLAKLCGRSKSARRHSSPCSWAGAPVPPSQPVDLRWCCSDPRCLSPRQHHRRAGRHLFAERLSGPPAFVKKTNRSTERACRVLLGRPTLLFPSGRKFAACVRKSLDGLLPRGPSPASQNRSRSFLRLWRLYLGLLLSHLSPRRQSLPRVRRAVDLLHLSPPSGAWHGAAEGSPSSSPTTFLWQFGPVIYHAGVSKRSSIGSPATDTRSAPMPKCYVCF